MPFFGDRPSTSLTTQPANSSRLVTKVRYIVEVINGRINKRFKYFDKTIRNNTVHTLFLDFPIVCALLNFLFKPSSPASPLDHVIVFRMLSFASRANALSVVVEQERLNALTSRFTRLESSVLDEFPRLEESDLKVYTCGTYALKIAHRYYADHLNENGDFEFQVAALDKPITFRKYGIPLEWSDRVFIEVRIRFRYSMSLKYFVYLLIDKRKASLDVVVGHYCNCCWMLFTLCNFAVVLRLRKFSPCDSQ